MWMLSDILLVNSKKDWEKVCLIAYSALIAHQTFRDRINLGGLAGLPKHCAPR